MSCVLLCELGFVVGCVVVDFVWIDWFVLWFVFYVELGCVW